jgi:hypothetical protein
VPLLEFQVIQPSLNTYYLTAWKFHLPSVIPGVLERLIPYALAHQFTGRMTSINVSMNSTQRPIALVCPEILPRYIFAQLEGHGRAIGRQEARPGS